MTATRAGEAVDDAADGAGRCDARVDTALGDAGEASEDVRADRERRRACSAVPGVS